MKWKENKNYWNKNPSQRHKSKNYDTEISIVKVQAEPKKTAKNISELGLKKLLRMR